MARKKMIDNATDQSMVQNSEQQPEQPLEQQQETIAPVMLTIIGTEEIEKAADTLQKYKEGKANLENRVKENEEWYRLRHWSYLRTQSNNTDPEPASAWLFNSIANKHADAMDNFPEPVVLPREQNDQQDADILSDILPVILQRNNFEQTYDTAWWDKLKNGTAIYGSFWNNELENGLGDIDDRQIDILNIFWQPGISDIQKSRNIFTVELVDNDLLEQQYPQLSGKLSSPTIDIAQYNYDDSIDTSSSSVVVDWYYKQTITDDDGTKRKILQYCKFCNGEVLFASENDPEMRSKGWYEHGMYPFVFDTLFPEKGTPCGFGYIDVAKDPQKYIDKLDQYILINADEVGYPRYFANDNLGLNESEYLDRTKKILHYNGRLDDSNFKQVVVQPLSNFVIQHQQNKIEEIKETSGNRDFSQGSTASGVTAASAIAALQEAGSKLSRDNIKSSYRKYAELNNMHIELIRQFYTEPRMFRITGKNGNTNYVSYNNTNIRPQSQGLAWGQDQGYRRPIFDIDVKAQKASPFSTVAQNELAKELYGAGFFNPQVADQAQVALSMMKFEGKDEIIQKISQNGMIVKILQLVPQLLPLAMQYDQMNGTNLALTMAQLAGIQLPTPDVNSSGGVVQTNSLGKAVQVAQGNAAAKAAQTATNISTPK